MTTTTGAATDKAAVTPSAQAQSVADVYPFLETYTSETIGAFVDENIAPNGIQGLDAMRVPVAKKWEKTDIFSGETTELDALTGILVWNKYGRALWPKYDPNTKSGPLCYSDDGRIGWGTFGIDEMTGEPSQDDGRYGRCFVNQRIRCPNAVFGSGDNGTGFACRENIMLFLIEEGSDVPITIRLAPTSVSKFRQYAKLVRKYGTDGVVTSLTLEREKGKPYAVVNFTPVHPLTEDEKATVRAYGAALAEAFPPRNADKALPMLAVGGATQAALPAASNPDSDGTVEAAAVVHDDF